jgi:hypothetical protein
MALAFPVLRPNQQLVRYECRGTVHPQDRGHIGISGKSEPGKPYSSIDTLDTTDEVAVESWLKNALDKSYHFMSVVATIRIEEKTASSTSWSTAYWTLYLRDYSM